jgi:hypothetical protein
VAYLDASRVRSFAVAQHSLPQLSTGDVIYIASGGKGAYRTVLRVEPIADGTVMITLDPGQRTGVSEPAAPRQSAQPDVGE